MTTFQIIKNFNEYYEYDEQKRIHIKEFVEEEQYELNMKFKNKKLWCSKISEMLKSYCDYWGLDDVKNKDIKKYLDFIYNDKNTLYKKMIEDENKNRGTGAGGKKTNMNGKTFEDKTSNYNYLIENEFEKVKINNTKFGYYLYKKNDDCEIYYCKQTGLKSLLKDKFSLNIFRVPDEAYIIIKNNGEKILIIIEQKNQNTEGSVETKLWAAPSLKREYELALDEEFKVFYTFIFNEFYQNKIKSEDKKWKILKQIFEENNINYFYGEEQEYFKKFNDWLNNL